MTNEDLLCRLSSEINSRLWSAHQAECAKTGLYSGWAPFAPDRCILISEAFRLFEVAELHAQVADQAATIESLQKQDEFHAKAMGAWQEWARGLLESGGLQLPDGQWGDGNARKILAGELERLRGLVHDVHVKATRRRYKDVGAGVVEALAVFDAQAKGGG